MTQIEIEIKKDSSLLEKIREASHFRINDGPVSDSIFINDETEMILFRWDDGDRRIYDRTFNFSALKSCDFDAKKKSFVITDIEEEQCDLELFQLAKIY